MFYTYKLCKGYEVKNFSSGEVVVNLGGDLRLFFVSVYF